MGARIVLAGGGTAGHIEPALAVADAIGAINPTFTCEFVGTKSGLEVSLVPARGYRLRLIPKVVMPRRISMRSIAFPFLLLATIVRSLRIVRGASLVIGFGGYVSAPIYLAARLLSIPIAIHEANAKPGFANRVGRPVADLVAVNFPEVQRQWPGSIVTGMPIRKSLVDVAKSDQRSREELRAKAAEKWGLDPSRPIVAIFGGSQGSQQINAVIAEFLKVRTSESVQFLHAVGKANSLPPEMAGYKPLPYFDDMAAVYAIADLLITRSGAMTCSELMTLDKFAILLPLDFGNGEQLLNALSLQNEGRAIVLKGADFSATWLAEHLDEMITQARSRTPHPSDRHIHAAGEIARLALERAGLM